MINKDKIICLDIETTGFDKADDDILQLSIIDGTGKVLFNNYLKPENRTSWEAAEAVNHISPAMVADKQPLLYYKDIINDILHNAELLVTYNGNFFDIPFLAQKGIEIPDVKTFDVMLEFAEIYGEWNEYHQNYKWQKLEKCAAYYGYAPEPGARLHDSLEDVKATLHCFYGMQN